METQMNRSWLCAVCVGALMFSLGGCDEPRSIAEEPQPSPLSDLTSATLGVTPTQFRTSFDRQAGLDRSDKTWNCNLSDSEFSCGFEIASFTRQAPTEAAAAIQEFGDGMPDEFFAFGLHEGEISFLNFFGSNSTTARRAHYIQQFGTLVRVLSPGITDADVATVISDLHLRSTPAERENESTAERSYTIMSCYQQDYADGNAINCRIDPPASAYPEGERPLTAENIDRVANGTGADWISATMAEKRIIVMTAALNGEIAPGAQAAIIACLDGEVVEQELRRLSLNELLIRCASASR